MSKQEILVLLEQVKPEYRALGKDEGDTFAILSVWAFLIALTLVGIFLGWNG